MFTSRTCLWMIVSEIKVMLSRKTILPTTTMQMPFDFLRFNKPKCRLFSSFLWIVIDIGYEWHTAPEKEKKCWWCIAGNKNRTENIISSRDCQRNAKMDGHGCYRGYCSRHTLSGQAGGALYVSLGLYFSVRFICPACRLGVPSALRKEKRHAFFHLQNLFPVPIWIAPGNFVMSVPAN